MILPATAHSGNVQHGGNFLQWRRSQSTTTLFVSRTLPEREP
jgi:hypothetical protein